MDKEPGTHVEFDPSVVVTGEIPPPNLNEKGKRTGWKRRSQPGDRRTKGTPLVRIPDSLKKKPTVERKDTD